MDAAWDAVRMRRRDRSRVAGGVSDRAVLPPEQVDALATLHCWAQQGSTGGLGEHLIGARGRAL